MQLSGKNIVNAKPENVWALLMDPEALARIVPGISRLEKNGENKFKSILEIKLGPVNGAFTGEFQLEDIIPNKGFTLKVLQNSKIGNANASIKIDLLKPEPTRTTISFNGEVKMTGLLAGMGQRIMGGVSNTLTKQFFTNLERELEKGNNLPAT